MMMFFVIAIFTLIWDVSFTQEFEQTCYSTRTGFRCLIPRDSIDGFNLYKLNKQEKSWEFLGAYKKSEKELVYVEGSSRYPGPLFKIKRSTRKELILYEVGCLSCGAVARRRFVKCVSVNQKKVSQFPK